MPDPGGDPLGCVVFEKLPLGSRVTNQARGLAAIAFYALMKNRKLKIRRRNGRTERQRVRVRPRALLGGHSPAGRGRGGPGPAGAPAPDPGASDPAGAGFLSRGAEFLEAWAPRAPERMGAEGAAAGRGRRVSKG